MGITFEIQKAEEPPKKAKKPGKKLAVDLGATGDIAVLVKTQDGKVTAHVTVPKVDLTPLSEVEALTSEYITLQKQYEIHEVKKLVARMEEIKKGLQTIANETMDPAQKAIFTSPLGEIEYGPRGTVEQVLNPMILIKDLQDKFGSEVAFSVVKIGITDLRKVLSELELEKYLQKKPGARILKSVRPKK